jgi:tetratricopeptide (TPR) repeat protein
VKRLKHIAVFLFALSFAIAPLAGGPAGAALRNNEPQSMSLMKRAANNPEEAGRLLGEAAEKSPDFPPVYFALAKNELRKLPRGLFTWSAHFIEGARAYGRNWWWSLDLAGLVLFSLMASFLLALFVTMAVRLPREFPLLKHDIRENRKHLLLFLPIAVSAVFGPVFFTASALMLPGLYFRKKDRALVYLALAVTAALPLMAGWLDLVYSSSSPAMRAVVGVNEGRDNSLALSALDGKEDFHSLFSRGLALKEAGRLDEAIASCSAALEAEEDPRAYVNLGNCWYLAGNPDKAKGLYEKANSLSPSASAFFNLSRLHREFLDFAKGDELFRKASGIDPARVSRFVRFAEKHQQMTLMDEYLGMRDFLSVLKRDRRSSWRISPFVPDALYTPLAALWAAFFSFYLWRGDIRAYRCSRCGKVMCPKCEQQPRWGQMCKDCYQSLVRLEAIDSKERVSRLLLIHGRQVRSGALMRTLSFAPPGTAHVYGGRVLPGMLMLWAFAFLVLAAALNPLFATGLSTLRHGWLSVIAVSLAALLYAASFLGIRRGQGKGWP